MSKMSLFPEFSNSLSARDLEVICESLDLTGTTLAKRLDVDPKTVSRWLHGDVPIPGSVALLMRVADELHKFSHSWGGEGLAAQDTPSRRHIR